MIKIKYCFNYLLLSILGLSASASYAPFTLAETVNQQAKQNQAELLTQKGHWQLNQGQAQEASQSWQQATKIYRQLQDSEGITGSLINENLALQTLGLYPRACETLLEALKMNAWICAPTQLQLTESIENLLSSAIHKLEPTQVYLLGLQNLGDALRLIGKLNESEVVLKKTLLLAQQTTPKYDVSGIRLSLASTKQTIYKRLQDKYYWVEEPELRQENVNLIQNKALESLEIYQFLISTSSVPREIQLQSQQHRLNLLLDFSKWLKREASSGNKSLTNISPSITQQIQFSVTLLLKNSSQFSQLPPTQRVYAKLNLANSLNQLQDKQLQSSALQYAQEALQTAKSINDQQLLSYSFGTLGKLAKRPEQSQAYFEKALGWAQSVHAWEIAYQWQQQLGDLYKKQGKVEEALLAYSAAIDNITQVRNNLSASNTDLQLSFYEKVEPVYRNYMRLLLDSSNPDLEKVIQTNERLQIAELENFLKCGKLDLITLKEIKNLNSAFGIIHIIDLDDRIEVIVQSPDKSLHRHSVASKLIREHVDNLLNNLQNKNLIDTDEYALILPYQALYKLLIAPINKHLPSSGTLVFTLDQSFQSLPMGLLHDGKDYLLKRYSVAVTLGSRVRPPKLLYREQFKALIAGLSKISQNFNDHQYTLENMPPLPQSKKEIEDIEQQVNSSLVLLDKNFTLQQLKQNLSKDNFPIIHIATHGQFSSDPYKTIILMYDRAINVLELDRLLKGENQADTAAIELLVLSACETAKGNKRSILGIAGIAAQAGARSTVASLWRVDADSTALLMKEFYKELKNGKPKAEALRQAQLSLMSNPEYRHPFYWAPFLLIGSWL
ncbi:CHAT domain-containing protein [Komarekiella sp. 'clone 1']|uniref:CHAT domain-containing protein n=1 Tax=Komarekiella delphini-convector SJRDD-AB1 TaxID=2593771 RepID=A0AA40VW29_9NOST|nr:CHAT domain-containing protein [Komarekiella delphini-convector]MBD6621258.1 CHAT domain-containing protein [Komarekiella delphini-convector SJRDD-AB1]